MSRAFYLLYGVVAYLIFFGTFLYLIAFVGDFPWVPRTIDRGGAAESLPVAIGIDLALVALFGLQHSIMARKGFKSGWTRIVPVAVERSTYVLLTSLILILMFLLWRPIPATLWSVASPAGVTVMMALFLIGWLVVLVSTFLINHFELFGLHQVCDHWRGRTPSAPVFREPVFYRRVRHPIYAGFLLAFWATPHMTQGHALFAAAMTLYILIAIRYEERDLVGLFGADYEAYRGRAGMLIPKLRRGA